ncbi:sulfatase [Pontiellaceae bacterium B12227]|nr:sulfatase [Pontiellaceae bacterium B12227]
MKRRSFMQATIMASVAPGFAAPTAKKPNIILFYVDDLGWMDLGVQGSKFYETPNIDRLASEGVRYTQGYTPHPRCLPARYGVITGRFPARGGVPGGKGHLQPTDRTMGHALGAGGYKTCFAGKWHLTGPHGEKNLPQNMGFDVNIAAGAAGAPSTYFYPYRKKETSKLKPGWEIGLDKDYIAGMEDGKDGDYITETMTTKCLDFIEDNAENPFFLYLSHYGVHTPFEAPERLVKKYKAKLKTLKFDGPEYAAVDQATGRGDQLLHQNNPVYAAMIESVDESLGCVFQTLEKLGIADDTIIAFTADNGGLSNRGEKNGKISGRPLATSNLPLKTGKGWLYEGGIREAFIVKWPGVTKPGFVNESDVVVGSDLFPTFLEMAGLPKEPQNHVDGVSMVPSLKGRPFARGPVFWHSPTSRPYSTGDTDSSAVRIGNYKLLEWYNADHVELYDLSKDVGEQNDLSEKMPEKAAEMLAVLHDWRKEINAHTREQNWGNK